MPITMYSNIKKMIKASALATVSLFIFVSNADASDRCKEKAQSAVELREDYNNLAEFYRDYNDSIANLNFQRSLGVSTANLENKVELNRLLAIEVFQTHKGAKGANLHKQVFSTCVALEKSDAERAARQAARAARQAARDAAKAEKSSLDDATAIDSKTPYDICKLGPGKLGPGYAATLRAAIRANTVFGRNTIGNPRAEFVVSLSTSCEVLQITMTSSSGNDSWDEAAERAIRTLTPFPKPKSGSSCPSLMLISHQPKDGPRECML